LSEIYNIIIHRLKDWIWRVYNQQRWADSI